MGIVAKFNCLSVKKFTPGNGEEVELQAVTGKANEPWSKWTPSGSLKMHITNPEVAGAFEPGKSYRLVVDEAPEGF